MQVLNSVVAYHLEFTSDIECPVVKLKFVNNSTQQQKTKPMGVLATIVVGFTHVAARPILILPILLLDLFIWFGPHVSIAPLLPSDLHSTLGLDQAAFTTEQVTALQEMVDEVGERANLVSGLSVLPQGLPFNLRAGTGSLQIGIPSLMSFQLPLGTPLGTAPIIEMTNPVAALIAWVAMLASGAGLAVAFHRLLVGHIAPETRFNPVWSLWVRVFALIVIAYGSGGVVIVLTLLLSAILWQIASLLGTGILLLGFSMLFWIAVYLVFTGHGIVRYGFDLRRAILESVHVVRFNLFSTIGFLFLAFGISWVGVEWVWSLPGEDSWFTLLAMLGHAFIGVTLLVASYTFYESRRNWLESLRRAVMEVDPIQSLPTDREA